MPEAHLFVGPSAFGLAPAAFGVAGLAIHPPIQRDDLSRLLEVDPTPRVALVCDGVFKSRPAVSHAELCAAIDAGWQVIGVSSIGAIRAFELRDEGMLGHGEVFSMFSTIADLTDDEVCLEHFPEPPYFPISEALVNVRWALTHYGPRCGIAPAVANDLVDHLRGLWFGHRTLDVVRERLLLRDVPEPDVGRFLAWVRDNRIKTLDLADLLARRPWRRPARGVARPR